MKSPGSGVAESGDGHGWLFASPSVCLPPLLLNKGQRRFFLSAGSRKPAGLTGWKQEAGLSHQESQCPRMEARRLTLLLSICPNVFLKLPSGQQGMTILLLDLVMVAKGIQGRVVCKSIIVFQTSVNTSCNF